MLHAQFLSLIEANAREHPHATVFTDVQNGYEAVTYQQLRVRAVRLVRALEEQGVRRGGYCAVDLENSAAFVYALIAAAYGGFGIVALNTRLTVAEKKERARELYQCLDCDALPRLDEETITNLLLEQAQRAEEASVPDVNTIDRYAKRGLANADDRASAVVMFTSGTQGRPKAANLTWGNLLGAAVAANERLDGHHLSAATNGCASEQGASTTTNHTSEQGESPTTSHPSEQGAACWQLTLPMYHVGGMAIVFRSMLAGGSFVLYRRFDAQRILRDARHLDVTHISAVDKMLQDLLDVEETTAPSPTPTLAHLSDYQCILLGGAAPNAHTLTRAKKANAPVVLSYGLTETSSCAATAPIDAIPEGFATPLPGYQCAVLNPNDDGVGRLAIKGPGVFEGYLNAQATFTPDGFFLTGDSARALDHRIQVAERSGDMFISGGENIYPQEIRDKLCAVPGVSDAHVFGVKHPTWGHRPVAFVEKADDVVESHFAFTTHVRASLEARLSRVYTPDYLLVVDEMPRTTLGKIDRSALMKLWERRVQIEKVELWRARLPLVHPIRTAKTTLRDREILLLRVTDASGRTGLGECAAFATDWYLPETIASCEQYLEEVLLPPMLHRPFLHPSDVSAFIATVDGASEHPLACATLETALWDMFGKAAGQSIRALIGGKVDVAETGSIKAVPRGHVPGGAVIGISTPKEAVEKVTTLVEQGYARVKIKVQPGHDVKTVKAVRDAFPDLVIALDANQSYKDTQIDKLRQMDALDIAFIEEPLRTDWHPRVGPQDIFARLARVQDELSAQVCLDESWTRADQLRAALEEHPELRCVAVKIAKFGGLQPALDFYDWARQRGIQMVAGGMFETGIGKRLHAAFCTLPGMMLPGDISSSSWYFTTEITAPAFECNEKAFIEINPAGYETGLGCTLDEHALAPLVVHG